MVTKQERRDLALIHYTVIMTLHNDARRMSNILREQFTPEERQEIKQLVRHYTLQNQAPEQVPNSD